MMIAACCSILMSLLLTWVLSDTTSQTYKEHKNPVGVIIFNLLAIPLPIFSIYASRQMVSMRKYRVCLLGSIALFLSHPVCCLFLSPVAVWSLYVLNRPEVKEAFSS
jgi:hypothetical protein